MRRPLLCTAVLAGAVLGLAASPSQIQGTGVIRGHVSVTGVPRVTNRPAVVYLESAPRQAFDQLQAGTARMDQRHEQFVPHVLAITVGTRVWFPNSDTTFHNVFSLSPVKTFDLGRYAVGHAKSVAFDKPGIVPVSCDIHSHMSAYILVFSHPFFAVTDDDGQYAIAGVPAGTYTLVAWSESAPTMSRGITLTSGGVTDADFQLGRRR